MGAEDVGAEDVQEDQTGGNGPSSRPDFATMKKTCTWQRLKIYIIPLAVTFLILLIVGAIGAATNSTFLTGLAESWPIILVVVLVVTALGVVLSSKIEGMYNELMDIKYTMKGLHEVIEWQMSFLKGLGKFVDKTEPEVEKAREFMDSWKQSMEPVVQDIKRVLQKIEKPIAEGVHDVERGFVAAEKRIEGLFHKDK